MPLPAPPTTYGDELRTAEAFAASGDRSHSLQHVLNALALEPNHGEWRGPLRTLLADATLRAGLEAAPFFEARAAWAFYLHETGNVAAALAAIVDVHRAAPHRGFDGWIAAWVKGAHLAGRQEIDATTFVRVLLLGTGVGGSRIRLLPAERSAAERFVEVAEVARSEWPSDPRIAALASSLFRRASRFEAALDAASQVETCDRFTLAGLAHRAAGAVQPALEAFEAALAASQDPLLHLEQFRVLADAGRWADALDAWGRYERGCAANAPPTDDSVAERAAVAAAAQRNAAPPAVPPLDIVRRRLAGHGRLCPMRDVTANALREVGRNDGLRAKGPTGAGVAIRAGKITMTVEGSEGPSNRLCLALMLSNTPDTRLAPYTCANVPFAPALWRADGDVIVQAPPSPPPAVIDWVEGVALFEAEGTAAERFESTGDFLDLWQAAADSPPPAANAGAWLAATVFPRMPLPRVCSGPEWVFRWQVACLIGLAQSERGWRETAKREALLGLLGGPADWTLAAALRVAAEVALLEPEATAEVRQVCIDLAEKLVNEPNSGILETLLDALQMLPAVPPDAVAQVHARILTANAPPATAPGSETAAAARGPAPRPWWKFWGAS